MNKLLYTSPYVRCLGQKSIWTTSNTTLLLIAWVLSSPQPLAADLRHRGLQHGRIQLTYPSSMAASRAFSPFSRGLGVHMRGAYSNTPKCINLANMLMLHITECSSRHRTWPSIRSESAPLPQPTGTETFRWFHPYHNQPHAASSIHGHFWGNFAMLRPEL